MPMASYLPPLPAQAVVDEDVGAEQEEQQHALEHHRDRRRQVEILLGLLPAEVEQRHEQAAEEIPTGLRRPMKATMMAAKP